MIDLTVEQSGAAVALVIAVVGALVAFVRWLRPRWKGFKRDVVAGRDALVGREAIVHPETGKELAPAVPGIGARMANVEQAIVSIALQQVEINDLKSSRDDLQHSRDDHHERITKLEFAAVERVVARAESAQAWRTVEEAIKAHPDVEGHAEEPEG